MTERAAAWASMPPEDKRRRIQRAVADVVEVARWRRRRMRQEKPWEGPGEGKDDDE